MPDLESTNVEAAAYLAHGEGEDFDAFDVLSPRELAEYREQRATRPRRVDTPTTDAARKRARVPDAPF